MAITFCESGIASSLNMDVIWKTTSGGTVFSSNLIGTAFSFFDVGAAVNDAVYFVYKGASYYTGSQWATLELDITTGIAGASPVIVWEYYCQQLSQWVAITETCTVTDNTNGLTTTGVNKVRYGRLPFNAVFSWTINGTTGIGISVRARLVSGTITNGGQHATTLPKVYDGYIRLSGYSQASPCTLREIYDYVSVNYPECGMEKLGLGTNDIYGEAYQLPNASIYTGYSGASLKTQNSYLKLGNGSNWYVQATGGFWEDGIRIGNQGFAGSKIVCAFGVGTNFNGGSDTGTKYYGTNITGGRYSKVINGSLVFASLGGSGYFGMTSGTYVGCNFSDVGQGYWTGTGEITNCIINTGSIVTYPYRPTLAVSGVAINYSSYSNGFFMLYSSPVASPASLTGVKWEIPAGGYVFRVNAPSTTAVDYYKYLNPSPAFPTDNSGTNKLMNMTSAVNGLWHIQEYYSLDLKVKDTSGTVISSATVKLYDKDENLIFTTTTDANGVITTQNILRMHAYYSSGLVVELPNPFRLEITKTGYETYKVILQIEAQTNLTIALKTAHNQLETLDGDVVSLQQPQEGTDSETIVI